MLLYFISPKGYLSFELPEREVVLKMKPVLVKTCDWMKRKRDQPEAKCTD